MAKNSTPVVGRLVIGALAFGQALVSLDASVVNVALPSIQSELGTSSSQMQLIVVAYMIALAGLILADLRFPAIGWGGSRSTCLALCCSSPGRPCAPPRGARGFSWPPAQSRGIGAACLMGLALAILTDSVERSKVPSVVAMWTTVTIAAGAAGPFVGGLLVTGLGWRSVFIINVPLAFFVFLVAARSLPNDRKSVEGKAGLGGGLLLVSALAAMTLGLTSLERAMTLSPDVVVPLAIAAVLFVVFVIQQRRTSTPMVQWGLLKTSPLPVTLGLVRTTCAGFGGRALPNVAVHPERDGFLRSSGRHCHPRRLCGHGRPHSVFSANPSAHGSSHSSVGGDDCRGPWRTAGARKPFSRFEYLASCGRFARDGGRPGHCNADRAVGRNAAIYPADKRGNFWLPLVSPLRWRASLGLPSSVASRHV